MLNRWTLALLLILFSSAYAKYLPPVISHKGMVVSDQYIASKVGADILQQGGNAMDAAVAVGYALAVVDPANGNIGGGGFMLVHWHNNNNSILDFRETAPAAIKASDFFTKDGKIKSREQLGYLTVGIPGTVMGLNTALEKYGTMTLSQVIAPAIQLADKGFILNRFDIEKFAPLKTAIEKNKNIRDIFTNHGKPLKTGDRLIQKNLAETLKDISQFGNRVFYQGHIAERIVASSHQHSGVLSIKDFKNYRVIWRTPLSCQYRGKTIITAPPPSSGVTICEILAILQGFPLRKAGFHSAKAAAINVDAMHQAFYDRNTRLGDPAFVKNNIQRILNPERIRKIQRAIAKHELKLPKKYNTPAQHLHTTHYVVIDKEHNVVSTTYTINSRFGANVISSNTGFFLNNELDDFAWKSGHANIFQLKQGKANIIAPNKRPLSSMSPTLLMDKNKVFMSLGAAGGPTIITSIVQTIENVLDYKMNISAAINSARFHSQWQPETVFMEPYTFSANTKALLKKMNFKLDYKLFGKHKYWGQVAAILLEKNEVTGSADNRSPNGRAVASK